MSIRNRNNKKIHNKGFTLIESVAALICVTLLTGLLLTITNLAKDTYSDLEMNSEGQMLSAVLINSIQDELRYASNIKVLDDSGDDSPMYDGVKVTLYSGTSSESGVGYPFSYYSKSLGLGADCRITSYDGRLYVLPSSSHAINPDAEANLDSLKKQSLAGESAYVFSLRAYVRVLYIPAKKNYHVTILITKKDHDNEIGGDLIYSVEDSDLDDLSGLVMRTDLTIEPLNPFLTA